MASIPNALQYYKSDGTRVLTSDWENSLNQSQRVKANGYYYKDSSGSHQIYYYNSHINGETICNKWEKLRSTNFYDGATQIEEVIRESRCNFGHLFCSISGPDPVEAENQASVKSWNYYYINISSTSVWVTDENGQNKGSYSTSNGKMPHYIIVALQGAGGGGGESYWDHSSAGGGAGGYVVIMLDIYTMSLSYSGQVFRITLQSGGLGGGKTGTNDGKGNNGGAASIYCWSPGYSYDNWKGLVVVAGGTGAYASSDSSGGAGGGYNWYNRDYVKHTFCEKYGASGGAKNVSGSSTSKITLSTSSLSSAWQDNFDRGNCSGGYSNSTDDRGGGGGASWIAAGGDGGWGKSIPGYNGRDGSGGGGGGLTGWFQGPNNGGDGGNAHCHIYAFTD